MFYLILLMCARQKMWLCVLSRKTDNMNTLLVPGRRTWTIKNPHDLKILYTLKLRLQDMTFEDKIVLGMKFRQIKDTNDKLAIGWSRCRNFKHMYAPGRTMSSGQSNVCVHVILPGTWHCVIQYRSRIISQIFLHILEYYGIFWNKV